MVNEKMMTEFCESLTEFVFLKTHGRRLASEPGIAYSEYRHGKHSTVVTREHPTNIAMQLDPAEYSVTWEPLAGGYAVNLKGNLLHFVDSDGFYIAQTESGDRRQSVKKGIKEMNRVIHETYEAAGTIVPFRGMRVKLIGGGHDHADGTVLEGSAERFTGDESLKVEIERTGCYWTEKLLWTGRVRLDRPGIGVYPRSSYRHSERIKSAARLRDSRNGWRAYRAAELRTQQAAG